MWTRRGVVGAGAVAAAGAAVGSGVWVASEPPAAGRYCLTAPECQTVAALGEALFPGRHIPIAPDDVDLVGTVDRIAWDTLDPVRRMGFRGVLRSIELGTLASRGRRFSALGAAERQAVLQAWSQPDPASRRIAYDSLLAVLAMAYYGDPVVRARLGWSPGCAVKGAT